MEKIEKYKVKLDTKVRFNFVEKLSKDLSLCKCYVMSMGKCRNGFVFLKEDVEKVLNSIYYKPVVGNIHVDEDGTLYMGEHDTVIKDGEMYNLTIPFGVVTETPATYELVQEDNGMIAEYLVVEVVLWTGRYPELLETIYSDEVWFNQSMEITINAFSPYEQDKRYKYVSDWEFDALCLLGRSDNPDHNTEPCFPSARVEPITSEENNTEDFALKANERFEKDFKTLIEEVKAVFKTKEESEIKDMDNELQTKGVIELVVESFACSQNKTRKKLCSLLSEKFAEQYPYVMSVFPDYCYFSTETYENNEYTEHCYKHDYSMNGDDIVLGENCVEVFHKYLTAEEINAIDSLRGTTEQFKADNEALERENSELKATISELEQFKCNTISEKENADKEAVFSKWEGKVAKEAYEAIDKERANLSVDELETKFKLAFADKALAEESEKANFSVKNESTVKIPLSSASHEDEKDMAYGGIFARFGKED